MAASVTDCIVALGANLGDRQQTLEAAASALSDLAVPSSFRMSSLHATEPVGGSPGQEPFLNGAARFATHLAPSELLQQLAQVEQQFRRERVVRWEARTLDLDLLAYGNTVLRSAALRLPHPRMSFRPFVLEPAVEIAGDWLHPELGLTLAELLDQLRQGDEAIACVGPQADSVRLLLQNELQQLGLDRRIRIDAHAQAPKLTIGLGDPPPAVQGPRLALADCPAGSARTEVRAALACVWPIAQNEGPP